MVNKSDHGDIPSPIVSAVRRLRHNLITVPLSTHPLLFFPVLRIYILFSGVTHSRIVSKNTDIVIDGFPRSANTFATRAFEVSQSRPVKIAHHVHAAAQIIAAAKRGIPTLVLIRQPDEAVKSYLVRHPYLKTVDVLKEYLQFYESIRTLRNSYVVATFGQVTTDFGTVIRRVNEKFGKDFDEFDHTEENVEECFHWIDSFDHKMSGGGHVRTSFVCRPSKARDVLKQQVASRLHGAGLETLWSRARQIYEEFQSYAGEATG